MECVTLRKRGEFHVSAILKPPRSMRRVKPGRTISGQRRALLLPQTCPACRQCYMPQLPACGLPAILLLAGPAGCYERDQTWLSRGLAAGRFIKKLRASSFRTELTSFGDRMPFKKQSYSLVRIFAFRSASSGMLFHVVTAYPEPGLKIGADEERVQLEAVGIVPFGDSKSE